jgi:phage-Barnase-EndoU-ColicinE5/D-RelE like nuclease3
LLIPNVLKNPDLVFESGKNKLGKDSITFVKQFEDKYIVVQEVREGKKTIALNSMRIFKTKRVK